MVCCEILSSWVILEDTWGALYTAMGVQMGIPVHSIDLWVETIV